MEFYMNQHVVSQEDETLVFPFGTLDGQWRSTDTDEEIVFTEIKFGKEEFERILNTNFSDYQKPLMSDEEYEAEFIENQEYERQAREYELMIKRRAENEENGIYYEDDYSDDDDEYVDPSYMYYDRC
jgi:hypothetical protein